MMRIYLACTVRGDRTGALQAFETAVRCRPYYGPAHALLGELLLQDGRPADARVHLRHAVAINPADSQSKTLLEKLGWVP